MKQQTNVYICIAAFTLLLVEVQTSRTVESEGLATASYSTLQAKGPDVGRKVLGRSLKSDAAEYGTSTTGSGVSVQATGDVNDAKADVTTISNAGPSGTSAGTVADLTASTEGGDLSFQSQGQAAGTRGDSTTTGYNSADFGSTQTGDNGWVNAQSQQSTQSMIDENASGTTGSADSMFTGFNSNLLARQGLGSSSNQGLGSGVANTYGTFGGNAVNVRRAESQTNIGTLLRQDGSASNSFLNTEASTQVDGPDSETFNTLGGETAARQGEGQSNGNAQATSEGTGRWISTDTAVNQRTDATDWGASTSGNSDGFARGSTKDGNLNIGYQQALNSVNSQGSARGTTQSRLSGEGDRFLGTSDGKTATSTTPFSSHVDSSSGNSFETANGSASAGTATGTYAERGQGSALGLVSAQTEGSGENFDGRQDASSTGYITDTQASQTNAGSSSVDLRGGSVTSDVYGGSKATLGDAVGDAHGSSGFTGEAAPSGSLDAISTVNTNSMADENSAMASSDTNTRGEVVQGNIRTRNAADASTSIGNAQASTGVRRDRYVQGTGSIDSTTSATSTANRNGDTTAQVETTDEINSTDGSIGASNENSSRVRYGDAVSTGAVRTDASAEGTNNRINAGTRTTGTVNVEGTSGSGGNSGVVIGSTDSGSLATGLQTSSTVSKEGQTNGSSTHAHLSGSGHGVTTSQEAASSQAYEPDSSYTSANSKNSAAASDGSINGGNKLDSSSNTGTNNAASLGSSGFSSSGENLSGSSTGYTTSSTNSNGSESEQHNAVNASATRGSIDATGAGTARTESDGVVSSTLGVGSVTGEGEQVNGSTETQGRSWSADGNASNTGSTTTRAEIEKGTGSGTSGSYSAVNGAGGHTTSGSSLGIFSGEGDQLMGSTTSQTNSYSNGNAVGSTTNDETWGRTIGGSLSIGNYAGSCAGAGCVA